MSADYNSNYIGYIQEWPYDDRYMATVSQFEPLMNFNPGPQPDSQPNPRPREFNPPINTNIQSLTKDDILNNAPKFSSIGYTFKTSNQNKYSSQVRSPNETCMSRYPSPYKQILLSKNPKDKIDNGFGVSIIGGIPMQNLYDTINKCIVTSGAIVDKVFQSSDNHFMGDLRKGDQIIEWNGVNLCNRSNEEVQQILLSQFSDDEVEIIYLPQANAIEASGNDFEAIINNEQMNNRMSNWVNYEEKLRSENIDTHRQLMLQTQAMINDFTKTSATNQSHRRKKSISTSIANIFQLPRGFLK